MAVCTDKLCLKFDSSFCLCLLFILRCLSSIQNLIGADPEILYTRLEKIGKGSFGEVFKGYEMTVVA